MAETLPSLSNADIAVAQKLDPVMRLKPHQRRFVEAYVRTSNGAEAARQAGYSKNGAAVRAKALLDKPEIQEAIQELMVSRAIASGLTVERLVTELAVLSLNRGWTEYDPESGTYIQHGAKDADRLKAIDMLMRHMGAYNDRLSITHDDPDIIDAAQRYGVDVNELVTEVQQLTSGSDG